MIGYLLLAGVLGQIGIVKSAAGDQIDFGPGAKCMLTLPDGYIVHARSSDAFIIQFDKGDKDERKRVWGSARLQDESVNDKHDKREKLNVRTFKNATIETPESAAGGSDLFGFEIVIGSQVIRFSSRTEAALPKPEDIVEACGSANPS